MNRAQLKYSYQIHLTKYLCHCILRWIMIPVSYISFLLKENDHFSFHGSSSYYPFNPIQLCQANIIWSLLLCSIFIIRFGEFNKNMASTFSISFSAFQSFLIICHGFIISAKEKCSSSSSTDKISY
jgi:hypothetical protein